VCEVFTAWLSAEKFISLAGFLYKLVGMLAGVKRAFV